MTMLEVLKKQHKIYNGTNHEINLYNMDDVCFARKNEYVLKEGRTQYLTIERENALNVYNSCFCPTSFDRFMMHPNQYNFQMPNIDFMKFQMIIVSKKYADALIEYVRFHPDPFLYNYLDRLFIPATSVIDYNKNKCGTLGLIKVFINTPSYYNALLANTSDLEHFPYVAAYYSVDAYNRGYIRDSNYNSCEILQKNLQNFGFVM